MKFNKFGWKLSFNSDTHLMFENEPMTFLPPHHVQELQDQMATPSTAERESEQREAELKAALVSLFNI